MSEFCGKCDVCDCLGDRSDEYLQHSRFFIRGCDDRDHEIQINNQKDLSKYYPYLISFMGADKNSAVIHISSECFIDSEEAEMIGWIKRELVKYYNKCKRNKIPYDMNEALKKACWSNPADWEKELARRVGESGERAEVKDLHRPMHEYYRKHWYEELINQGYSENEARVWVYGWERVWNEQKEKRSEEEDK